ncbi:hypothetical protein C9374_000700 [Naegleria lovaniensis]|uniref:F-box domain-containing protein n=1 Tax=Naegleria lovaniensis TaxID=51637 RepID=A0AA88GYW8_NAELO|nr:uncharacterized protein C9374_000700 [Naegleria lovaniensis]KAG2388536.1 hypothetical protein C9374_000700 [Naegleria lovaniensis]
MSQAATTPSTGSTSQPSSNTTFQQQLPQQPAHLINPIYTKKQKQRLISIRTRNKRKLPLNESIIFLIFSFMDGIDIESCCKASHIFQNVATDESKFLEYFINKYDPYTTFYHDYNRVIVPPLSAQQQQQQSASTNQPQAVGTTATPTTPIGSTQNTTTTNNNSKNMATGTPPLLGTGSSPTLLPLSPRMTGNFENGSSGVQPNNPPLSSSPSSSSMVHPLTPTLSFSSFSTLLPPVMPNNNNLEQPQGSPLSNNDGSSTTTCILSPTLIQKEEREYYKRPRCNWRNAVKYREQMQRLYRNGQVHLMKVYTQPDLKILTLSSSSLKEAIKGKGWIDIDNSNNDNISSASSQKLDQSPLDDTESTKVTILNTSVRPTLGKRTVYVSDEEEVRKEKEKLEKERERLVDEFGGIMNYSSTNTGDWKSNGFHLMDVRLLDGRVILNTRKNFRHTTKPFKHHFSYDLLTYSLYSAKDSHVANRLTGQRKQILNNMFEDDLPISSMRELHETLLSETDDFIYEQWVARVINCSSEYISRNRSESGAAATTADNNLSTAHSRADYPPFSVLNLMGVVNTYPKYGSFGTAWSPSNRSFGFGSLEFLEFEIEEDMHITEIRIFETFCPGGVFKISLWDRTNQCWDTVWLGKPYDTNCRMMERARVFAPKLFTRDYATNRIRIDFDLRKSPSGWTEVDGILVRGYLYYKDRLPVLARQQLQTKKDTISLNKEILHFPYSYLSHSPFDYQFGVLCFVYTESSYYHINSTLVVIGGTELLKDEVFLEVTYSKDYIVAVKLLSNKTCMVVVKMARVPVQYCVHIYDITLKKLTKTFELKELPTDSKEIKFWELTQQIIACAVDRTIYVYDVSHSSSVNNWRLLHTLDTHQSTITSLSLNTELIDLCNVLVSGSADKTVKVWSLHTGNCLMTLLHPGPVSCVKIIAAGSMVATACINESVIRIWSICGRDAGKLVRVLALPTLSSCNEQIFTQKEIFFDESYFIYFEKGTNEYMLGRFYESSEREAKQDGTEQSLSSQTEYETWVGGKNVILNKYNIVNKYQGNADACTIL